LAPSDFHLFGPLKNHVGGKRFPDDEEVETEVWKWLRQQLEDFYAVDFDALIKVLGKVNQRWWRICREINVFFQVRI
jgi:hypothetical protein